MLLDDSDAVLNLMLIRSGCAPVFTHQEGSLNAYDETDSNAWSYGDAAQCAQNPNALW